MADTPIFLDTFTDTEGTRLSEHVPEIGAWKGAVALSGSGSVGLFGQHGSGLFTDVIPLTTETDVEVAVTFGPLPTDGMVSITLSGVGSGFVLWSIGALVDAVVNTNEGAVFGAPVSAGLTDNVLILRTGATDTSITLNGGVVKTGALSSGIFSDGGFTLVIDEATRAQIKDISVTTGTQPSMTEVFADSFAGTSGGPVSFGPGAWAGASLVEPEITSDGCAASSTSPYFSLLAEPIEVHSGDSIYVDVVLKPPMPEYAQLLLGFNGYAFDVYQTAPGEFEFYISSDIGGSDAATVTLSDGISHTLSIAITNTESTFTIGASSSTFVPAFPGITNATDYLKLGVYISNEADESRVSSISASLTPFEAVEEESDVDGTSSTAYGGVSAATKHSVGSSLVETKFGPVVSQFDVSVQVLAGIGGVECGIPFSLTYTTDLPTSSHDVFGVSSTQAGMPTALTLESAEASGTTGTAYGQPTATVVASAAPYVASTALGVPSVASLCRVLGPISQTMYGIPAWIRPNDVAGSSRTRYGKVAVNEAKAHKVYGLNCGRRSGTPTAMEF